MGHLTRRGFGRWAVIPIALAFVYAMGSCTRPSPTVGAYAHAKSAEPRTLVMSYDMLSAWVPARNLAREGADAAAIKDALHEIIDQHARAGVDVFVQCVFARFETQRPGFKSAQPRKDLEQNGITRLIESGEGLVQIMLERCRSRGMTFLAGLRMNDRHRTSDFVKRMHDAHPEWKMMGHGINYEYEGARLAVLAFIEECLDTWDVDGLEFDYLRFGHVFEPSKASGQADLLNDFTRRTRQLLDAAAKKRGRERLILGVRVPQTLEECRSLGYDVETWIREGLVDIVCPSDFFYTDFNARTEDFVALAKGTRCRIYPSVHPVIASGNQATLLDAAAYRGAAKNFYAYGADGVSAYNYQYNWAQMYGGYKFGPRDMWPAALQFVAQLRQEALIDAADRRYLFHPLWSGRAPTGATKNDRIVLERAGDAALGELRFRLAEDFSDSRLAVTMRFKTTGMVEDDRIEIGVNGKTIASGAIERRFDADGQTEDEGRALEPFFHYRFVLPSNHLRFGDNMLSARLAESAGNDRIDIQEVEIEVAVSD